MDDGPFLAAASSSGSRASRPSRGLRLRLLRRQPPAPTLASRGGAEDDLALPLGMSFAAVLARVLNSSNESGERLHPAILSKICTSAMKKSLAKVSMPLFLSETYVGRTDSFMRNFENSFSCTLMTLHGINEIPLHERSPTSECSFKHEGSAAVENSSAVDSPNCTEEVRQDLVNSVESQLVLYARDNQQLADLARSRSSREADRCILSAFARSVEEQARSNELKEYEIGLSMRKLQLKQSQLALSSYSHMLEKIKLSLGFQKASFQGEKFKNQMQDLRHAEILRTLTDFLVSAVVIMSACFAYGTYVHSYQRITDVTAACLAASRGSKSWWVPNSVSNFNSGLRFIRCHVIAVTRMCFGLVMIVAIAWLASQRSALPGSNMPITFNFVLLGAICRFAGRFCANTLGGDGNIWFVCWEVLCFIHLLGSCYPSVMYRVLHGPISITHIKDGVWLPYWVRRCIFYALLGLIIPALTGLLPFASVSDWKGHFSEEIKSFFVGDKVEA